MKTSLSQVAFASLDMLLAGCCILIFFVFTGVGGDLNFYRFHLGVHHLNNPFLIMVGLFFLKVLLDPDCAILRKFFMTLENFLSWIYLYLGALSTGLFFWIWQEPVSMQKLFLMDHSHWKNGLREYLQFYVFLFHLIWIIFSNQLSRRAPEKMMEVLRKDAFILGCAVFALIFSFAFMQYDFEQTEILFFIAVIVFSVLAAFKVVLWEVISQRRILFNFEFKKLLWGCILAFVGIFTFLGIRKLDLYLGNGDFPVYLQPLWNTLHGQFMQINWFYTAAGQSKSWFGEHLNLIYFFLLPIYKIFQNARIFIFLQSLLIGLAAWPIFEIVKTKFKDNALAFVFAFAYLANPLVSRALLFDFHAEAAEPLLILLTFLFLERKQWTSLVVSAVLLLCCKEDAAIYLMAFGLYAGLYGKDWERGLLCLGLGTGWLFFALGWAIPTFSQGAQYHTLAARYSWLGEDFKSIFFHLILYPMEVLKYLFNAQSLKGFGYLLIPLAMLPIIHWSAWILILPATLELFLSTFEFMKRLSLHYPWFICPFYYLAAIVSLAQLKKYRFFQSPMLITGLAGFIFFASIFFHYFFDPRPVVSGTYCGYYVSASPFGKLFNPEYYCLNDHDRYAKVFIKKWVPEMVSLSVDHRFSHDVSNRYVLRMFPERGDSDYIFLDTIWDYFYSVTRPVLTKRKLKILDCLVGKEFGVKIYEDGYLLLERGFSQDQNLAVARDIVGFFEAEAMSGAVGQTVIDSQAYNKRARLIDQQMLSTDYVIKTPKQFFHKGPIDVLLRMKTDQCSSESQVCRVEVFNGDSDQILLQHTLRAKDFIKVDAYNEIHVHFENAMDQSLGMGILMMGQCNLWVDHVRWSSVKASWQDLEQNLHNQS